MELIKVVDRNGNFTGKIMDKEEVHNKNLFHYEVGIFIINDKQEILLQKRSANKRYSPNKWGLCAGHVKATETLEEAALRELKEEVGLDIKKEDLKQYGTKEIQEAKLGSGKDSHITIFYYVKCNKNEKDFIIQKEELSEVKWFTIEEIIKMIKEDKTSFKENRIDIFKNLKNIK